MSAASLAMFPGQGSQYVGMGKDLLTEFPYTKEVFEEAEDAAGFGIRKLCFDGPESDLTKTANQQPAILTVTIAIWRILQNETPFQPQFFAGHSLGEYSALVAAGKLTLGDAARLVRFRGEAMQRAVPEGIGAMAAVINCDAGSLQIACEKAAKETASCVDIVNFNSPQQLIISGHKKAVDAVCGAIVADAKVRCTPLPVSAPFHSKLMKPARDEMTPRLKDTRLIYNEAKVIPNLTGNFVDRYEIDMLIEQIDHPVLWTQTLDAALTAGCQTFVEIGPGRVLSGLARRSVPKGNHLVNTDDLAKTVAEFTKS
jgi:[acyl-carrier-protein] S-malonyltransferase